MEKNILRNEKGVALILALIMLLVLTFIGISAISTTTFETNISGNERVGAVAFYASEAIFQMGLKQIPDNYDKPIPRTKIGEDSYGWSGTVKDKEKPKAFIKFSDAPYPIVGTSIDGSPTEAGSLPPAYRYQMNVTGESFSATKEIEIQMVHSLVPIVPIE